MKCETCGKDYSTECDYRQGRCPHHKPTVDLKENKMFSRIDTWIREHLYELSFFVAGWCGFATLDSLGRENYFIAMINAALVYINIKLAKNYKA